MDSKLQSKISTQNKKPKTFTLSKGVRFRFCFGGGKGIRTPGLRVANAALYQLSHTPIYKIY